MLTFEHRSSQRPAETGNFRIDKPSSPPVEPLHDGESINAERALVLKDQYYAELLRLQSIEIKGERNKDKIIALAKGMIFFLEIVHKGKMDTDSQPQVQRSSGFNKSMKDKLYRRLGGCHGQIHS